VDRCATQKGKGMLDLVGKYSSNALKYAGLYQKTLFTFKPFRAPRLKPSQFEELKSHALKAGVSEKEFDEVSKLPEVMPINKYVPLIVTSKPVFFNNKWFAPAVGKLQLVRCRELALLEGIPKEEFPVPEPERVPMKTRVNPPKGHKRDAKRVERADRIKALMAKMPQMIAEYKKERKEQKDTKKSKSPIADVLEFRKEIEKTERKVKKLQKTASQPKKKKK